MQILIDLPGLEAHRIPLYSYFLGQGRAHLWVKAQLALSIPLRASRFLCQLLFRVHVLLKNVELKNVGFNGDYLTIHRPAPRVVDFDTNLSIFKTGIKVVDLPALIDAEKKLVFLVVLHSSLPGTGSTNAKPAPNSNADRNSNRSVKRKLNIFPSLSKALPPS